MTPDSSGCVLLFSGGRDSSIAALRLSARFSRLILVTVTSDHLLGIESVYRRLAELKERLPPNTLWMHIPQPTALESSCLFRAPTCLPCHCSYVAIGAVVAECRNAGSLALGYTHYQSEWPEQTPYAIERLTRILASRGISLVLPVYEMESKDRAIAELAKYGMFSDSLEQKCLRQQFNVSLEPSSLKEEITIWEQVLVETIHNLSGLQIEVTAEVTLGKLSNAFQGLSFGEGSHA